VDPYCGMTLRESPGRQTPGIRDRDRWRARNARRLSAGLLRASIEVVAPLRYASGCGSTDHGAGELVVAHRMIGRVAMPSATSWCKTTRPGGAVEAAPNI
jgi:hypothetical protein